MPKVQNEFRIGTVRDTLIGTQADALIEKLEQRVAALEKELAFFSAETLTRWRDALFEAAYEAGFEQCPEHDEIARKITEMKEK